jgi:hypothetical protein
MPRDNYPTPLDPSMAYQRAGNQDGPGSFSQIQDEYFSYCPWADGPENQAILRRSLEAGPGPDYIGMGTPASE